MVTGDHIQTAITVAQRVGIINQEERNIDGIALTGE
jgi:magnesium-transporting ATPase (P-type)